MVLVHGLPPTRYMSLGKSVYLLNGCCEDPMNYYMSSLQMVTAALKLKDTYSLEEKINNLDSILKSKDITLPTRSI